MVILVKFQSHFVRLEPLRQKLRLYPVVMEKQEKQTIRQELQTQPAAHLPQLQIVVNHLVLLTVIIRAAVPVTREAFYIMPEKVQGS